MRQEPCPTTRERTRRRSYAARVALAIGVTGAHANDLCGTTITEDTKLDHDQNCSGTTGITIATPGVTLDLCGFTVDGDDTFGHHGIVITADRVTVKNGTVRDFEDGVRIRDADRVTLKNLWVISNRDDGVNAEESRFLTLDKVRANNNGEEGADIDTNSNYFTIKYSTFNGNGFGSDNDEEGVDTDDSHHGKIIHSEASDNDDDYGVISHSKADNNDDENFEINTGVYVKITHNVATDGKNGDGFELDRIEKSLIKKNIAKNNDRAGFDIESGSDNNTVTLNKAIDNDEDGIEFSSSSDGNDIHSNVAKKNSDEGFLWQGGLSPVTAAGDSDDPADEPASEAGPATGPGGGRSLYGAVVVTRKNTFRSNIALKNDLNGFLSSQRGAVFKGNVSGKNGLYGILAPNVSNGGLGYASGANTVFGNGNTPQCSSGVACTVLY